MDPAAREVCRELLAQAREHANNARGNDVDKVIQGDDITELRMAVYTLAAVLEQLLTDER